MTGSRYDAERFFVRRLGDHGVTVYLCSTSPETCRENIRRGIADGGLAGVIIGSKGGKPETYEELFQRVYGEPLVAESQTQQRKSA